MSGSEHIRPFWLTKAEVDEINASLQYEEQNTPASGSRYAQIDFIDWDAAPADPTEAVKAALAEHANGTADLLERLDLAEAEHYDVDEFDDEANLVLRALGIPDA